MQEHTTPERQEELESLFKKPQFRVYGTTMIDDVQHFVLQSRDLGGAVATVPITEINSMTIVADEGLGGGDKAENFTYTQAAEDQTAIDAQQKQNFKQNKENLQKFKEFPNFEMEDEAAKRLQKLDLEKQKRRFINSLIQGSAKKAHYMYQ